MTKKQFVEIAAIISDLPPEYRHKTAVRFAQELSKTNPHFNMSKFIFAATEDRA